MSIRKRRQKQYTAEERNAWISQYDRSGLTQQDFAETHDLNVGTLRRWLQHERSQPTKDLEAKGFQELCILPATGIEGWSAELELSFGHRLRLSANMPSEWVVNVLKGLRTVCLL